MRRFTETHEWIEIEGTEGVVGVTAYAQKELGDVVFISLPEIGKHLSSGDEAAILESTKAASDVYAPVSGVVTQVNTHVKENPTLLNQAPETEGWLYKLSLHAPEECDRLLTQHDYEKVIKGHFSP